LAAEVVVGATTTVAIHDSLANRAGSFRTHCVRRGKMLASDELENFGGPRGRSTFTKRQKEHTRQQRQRDKAERRNQRKQQEDQRGRNSIARGRILGERAPSIQT